MKFIKSIFRGGGERGESRSGKSPENYRAPESNSSESRQASPKKERLGAEAKAEDTAKLERRILPGIAERLAGRNEGATLPESFFVKGQELLASIEANTDNAYDRDHMNTVAKLRGGLEAARSMTEPPETAISGDRDEKLSTFLEIKPEAAAILVKLEDNLGDVINHLRIAEPDTFTVSLLLSEVRKSYQELRKVETKGVPNAAFFDAHLSGLQGQIDMIEGVMSHTLQKQTKDSRALAGSGV